MEIKIFTAFHKEFEIPNDTFHIPIHVWKAISNINLDIIWDDTWDNISYKNKNYCELTMLYWVWKNYNLNETDFVWLAHYRRLFNLDNKVINKILDYDIILPKKERYSWLMFPIMSLKHSYYFWHIKEDFDITYNALIKLYPEYEQASKILFKKYFFYQAKGYFFNMFIMKKDIFYEYCDWIFNILFEAEKDIKISGYEYQARVFWFLSERFFNVFIEKKRKEWYKILEIDLLKK